MPHDTYRKNNKKQFTVIYKLRMLEIETVEAWNTAITNKYWYTIFKIVYTASVCGHNLLQFKTKTCSAGMIMSHCLSKILIANCLMYQISKLI